MTINLVLPFLLLLLQDLGCPSNQILLRYSIAYSYKDMYDQIFKKPVRPTKDDCQAHKSPGIESLSIWFFKKMIRKNDSGKNHNQRIALLWKLVLLWFFGISEVFQPSTH